MGATWSYGMLQAARWWWMAQLVKQGKFGNFEDPEFMADLFIDTARYFWNRYPKPRWNWRMR